MIDTPYGRLMSRRSNVGFHLELQIETCFQVIIAIIDEKIIIISEIFMINYIFSAIM